MRTRKIFDIVQTGCVIGFLILGAVDRNWTQVTICVCTLAILARLDTMGD